MQTVHDYEVDIAQKAWTIEIVILFLGIIYKGHPQEVVGEIKILPQNSIGFLFSLDLVVIYCRPNVQSPLQDVSLSRLPPFLLFVEFLVYIFILRNVDKN